MLEKEINFISDFNLNKIKKLGSFFTFEKLKNSDIHPSIVQYISAHLDFLIFEDRKSILERSVFDYSGPEIAKYFYLITEEVKKNKRISFEDIKTLVLQAVSFNANFLIRPKWSLGRLIFEGAETKPVEEVRLVLNYCYYYDFLKSIFGAYLKKRHVFTISQDEFEDLFEKIDREVFSLQPKQFIENTLFGLADFFNIGGVSKSKVPLFAVETFLKEKNLTDYIFRLKRAIPLEPKLKYEVDELRNILLSSAPLEKQVILKSRTVEIPPETEFAEETREEIEETPLDEIVIDFKKEEANIDEMFEIENMALKEFPEAEAEPGPILDSVERIEDFLLANNEETINDIMEFIESKENPDGIISSPESMITEETAEENSQEADVNELKEMAGLNELEEMSSEDEFEEESIEETASDPDLLLPADIIIAEQEDESIELEIEQQLLPEPDELTSAEDAMLNAKAKTENEIMTLLDEIEGRDSFGDFSSIGIPDVQGAKNDFEETAELKMAEEEEEYEERFAGVQEEEENPIAIPEDETPRVELVEDVPEKDITELISEKDASKMIKTIFKDDNVDFIITLGKISKCKTYEEATEILKSVFASYKVDPYSREANKLTNVVAEYFNF